MTLSLEQRSSSAQRILASPIGPVEAARAAKRLVGSYAHMKPSDADTFVESVMAVLSGYPAGLVAECVDPRTGVARTLKFLSIAELVEWLDARQRHYQSFADWRPRPPALPPPTFTEEHKATMRQRLVDLFRRLATRADPIDEMKRAYRTSRAQGAPSRDQAPGGAPNLSPGPPS
jgi:hypothetical protein